MLRDDKNQQKHDTLLDMVARKIKIPVWDLTTNPGSEQNAGVAYPSPTGQAIAYPDWVAYERFTKKLAAVGEVETEESVSDAEAAEEWSLFVNLAPKFFLYLPKECEEEGKRLLRKHRLRPEGLFLYRFTERNLFVVERAKGR